MVARLLELGHGDVVEAQAARGEWFCAHAQAKLLAGRNCQAEALDVLAPYLATGWWKAAKAAAELLEGWGKHDEAIALLRPHTEDGGYLQLGSFARLLARHGHGAEAFTLLRPHMADWFLATALVDVAAAAGLDEDAAELLTARIHAKSTCGNCGSPSCHRSGVTPSNAIGLLAEIRERQGSVDDAIALLHTRDNPSVNNRDQLADLLARHGRFEELHAYAVDEYHGHAAARLVEWLEDRGDIEGAIKVYQDRADSPACFSHAEVHLAELLARHGRVDEAIAVMRALADGGPEDWIVSMLCTMYADHDRAREGLAYLDDLRTRRGREEWEIFQSRVPLLVASGLREEAIAQARVHPEGDSWYAASTIAEILADAGRVEEAVAVLEPHAPANSSVLAWHLIDLGRVEEAVAHLQRARSTPLPPADTTYVDTPPF